MFDLTKQIPLDKKNYASYRKAQAAFYAFAVAIAIVLVFIIIFPTQYFSFSFPNPNSTKNTVISPRSIDGNFADRGRTSSDAGMIFDTAVPGNYSTAKISFTLDKDSEMPQEASLSARKSYQAFFYPEAEILDSLPKNEDLEKLPDGSLVSYGNSVYILSGNFMHPIDSVETFNAAGFSWNDVIPVSSDQLSAYEKGKLFTLFSPHPNGTILADENNNLFLIKDGKKHPLSDTIRTEIKRNPVLVSSQSLDISQNCQVTKNTLGLRTYSCSMSLEKFRTLFGKDYEFVLTSDTDMKIDTLEVTFATSVTLENMKLAFSDILTKIKRNYYGEPTQ